MTLIFANGGLPVGNEPYPGLSFTNGTILLGILQTQLTNAGWSLHSTATDQITMRGETTNGHFCYVRFTIINASSTLEIRGDLTGSGATLSPANILFVNFNPGQDNRIFITADHDSAAICVLPFSQAADGFHFGFLDRRDTSDQYAWMVGRLLDAVDSAGANHLLSTFSNGYTSAYVARETYTDSINWRQLGSAFSASFGSSFVSTSDQPRTLSDVPTQIAYFQGPTSTSVTNVGYYHFFGGVERDSAKPIIAPYFYLEGYAPSLYGSVTNGVRNANNLYFRGFVKHAVTGLASFNAGIQWNTDTGKTFLSAGGRGWQGFRIA